ncbi:MULTISPECIES: hypothetical protein [Myroides]|uniref:Uncharacterized protein n=1 Tax=Myroides albus TaxID=2562892 RepID=A0A6I3LGM4_9FLAO|nr:MULTISPECIES: hypothetical protein [Myroides]MTG96954.1 hypothetical protein [Myroides albus]MVX35353.1 hypothetical protein [Myroides sp. LoEW2-1]UVD78294.1 hypothetical protein NWE55_09105 [Myroides albus]
MKNLVKIFGIVLGTVLIGQVSYGQELVEDQNPNYRNSMYKYVAIKDSLTTTLSTTVQDTYKAYDWYEAKQERKAQRKLWKHEERMARAKYGRNHYYSDYYGNSYGGYYNGYNSGWNWNWLRPSIGFKTGNWFFSI